MPTGYLVRADQSGNAIVAAAGWLEGTVLGSISTGIAVIAIGAFGFGMLGGRVSPRRGAQVVLGCFIVFAAPSIAAGIASLAGDDARPRAAAVPAPTPIAPLEPPPVRTRSNDPYAGASVPM